MLAIEIPKTLEEVNHQTALVSNNNSNSRDDSITGRNMAYDSKTVQHRHTMQKHNPRCGKDSVSERGDQKDVENLKKGIARTKMRSCSNGFKKRSS